MAKIFLTRERPSWNFKVPESAAIYFFQLRNVLMLGFSPLQDNLSTFLKIFIITAVNVKIMQYKVLNRLKFFTVY